MKKFSLFLFVLTFCCLLNSVYTVDPLSKQAAVAFVQQEGFTLDCLIEWAKDPQNYYIDALNPEIKQALGSAIEKKFRGVLDFLFSRILVGHTDRVTAVAFSRSGNYIATGSRDRTAKLWQRSTGGLLASFDDSAEITAIALSDDESLLITASTALKVWNIKTGHVEAELPLNERSVHSLKINADNRFITIVYKNEHDHEQIWDLVTDRCTACYKKTNERYSIMLHKYHQIQSHNKTKHHANNILRTECIYMYNLGTVKENIYCTKPAYAQLYVDDSNSNNISEVVWSTVELFDQLTGKKLIFTSHTDEITAVVLCLDKNRVVTGSSDTRAKVWDLLTGKLLLTLEGHSGSINAVDISNNGSYVVTGSHDTTVRVWDIGYLTGQVDFDAFIAYLRSL